MLEILKTSRHWIKNRFEPLKLSGVTQNMGDAANVPGMQVHLVQLRDCWLKPNRVSRLCRRRGGGGMLGFVAVYWYIVLKKGT